MGVAHLLLHGALYGPHWTEQDDVLDLSSEAACYFTRCGDYHLLGCNAMSPSRKLTIVSEEHTASVIRVEE
jgi:hypothetical protein